MANKYTLFFHFSWICLRKHDIWLSILPVFKKLIQAIHVVPSYLWEFILSKLYTLWILFQRRSWLCISNQFFVTLLRAITFFVNLVWLIFSFFSHSYTEGLHYLRFLPFNWISNSCMTIYEKLNLHMIRILIHTKIRFFVI